MDFSISVPVVSALLLLLPTIHAVTIQQQLCNSTYADKVNGSGIVDFSPGIRSAQKPNGDFSINQAADWTVPNASWLVTVQQPEGLSSAGIGSFWYNTGGIDYWNDEKTLFDACAFVFLGPFPTNTIDLSQDDPGDCSNMLTSYCRSALISQIE